MEREKAFIYIDTNFSNDEALMLDMAFRSYDFELVGLSSVRSFMEEDLAADNILGLNEAHDLYLPIARGEGESLSKKELTSDTRGKAFYKDHRDYLEEYDAADNIYDLATDCGRLDILTTGPLTNIARALERYEDLEDYISHIFISGGDLFAGEDNFMKDPKAINKVLNSSIEVFILPKNLANGIEIKDSFIKNLKKDEKNEEIIQRILADKEKRSLYAPLLLYLLETPEAFIFEESGIKVDDKENIGEMIRTSARKKAYLATRVNEESFLDYIKAKLCQ